jgi:hypothetical protein
MKLLFMDIADHVRAQDYMEGAIIARTLKFKINWDFLYSEGSWFYAPIVKEQEYGNRINQRTTMDRPQTSIFRHTRYLTQRLSKKLCSRAFQMSCLLVHMGGTSPPVWLPIVA